MGTRSNIAILLDEKDLNKDIRFDWEKIKHPYGEYIREPTASAVG